MTFELCLITQPDCLHIKRYLSFIEEAISGGVTLVQFREKASHPAERYQFAKSLKALLDVYHIPLLINDDLELALAIYADGIHLGQSDVHPKEASKKLGKEKYIGLSIETLSQLETANTLDCIHYVAASAVFHSPTKKDCKTIWGLDGLTQICQYSRHPVMAIGGITLENLPFVMAAGACGIATISALHHTANPMQTAQSFLKIIKDSTMFEDVFTHVQKIKNTQPLILNLTNYVTMELVANGLLSLGASPVMTHSIEEVADLVRIAQGVVINIGTLNASFIERVKTACKTAMDFNKTLVLDPVGAGATHYRTVTCLDLLEQFQFTVIRGNASEIIALDGKSTQTKGVDTTNLSEEAVESATNLSSKYQATVVISGKNDFIVTNDIVNKIERGTSVMTRITGAGCLLTAVITAFNAVCDDSHFATSKAMLFYNIAGEIAAQKSEAPGSFQHHFLDALSFLPKRAHYA